MRKKETPKGTVYKSMKKHRLKFLVTEILLVILLISYFCASYEYISNIFTGGVAFDEARFAKEAETIEVGEPFELHRNDNVSINDYALRPDSYWQGNHYEFVLNLTHAQKLGISYNNQTTLSGSDETYDEISSNLYVADIGGIKTLVLAYPHQNLADIESIDGIFTAIPLIVAHDVAASGAFKPTDEICKYMIDTRGIEMESERFDLIFCAVLFGIIIYLAAKLALQFADYHFTPTYRQLAKYGPIDEIEAQVDAELADARKEKKQLVTASWIVSEDTFKLKIVKNHMKHGKFAYTPKV